MATRKRRGGKARTIYGTKSGSYTGFGQSKKTQRGRPVKRISRATGRDLGLLKEKNRAAAHKRKKAGR